MSTLKMKSKKVLTAQKNKIVFKLKMNKNNFRMTVTTKKT